MRALVLLLCAGCATSQVAATAPGADRASLDQLRDRFVTRAARAGVRLPSPPAVREETRPSLISWRAETHSVAVPRWEELSPDQRALLEKMARGVCAPQQLFDWLFRWYLVPHELTHALMEERHTTLGHYASEQYANDLAAALFVEEPADARRLASLDPILAEVVTRLPAPGGIDEFERGQLDLPRQIAYQLFFIRRSLARRTTLRFDDLVRKGLLR